MVTSTSATGYDRAVIVRPAMWDQISTILTRAHITLVRDSSGRALFHLRPSIGAPGIDEHVIDELTERDLTTLRLIAEGAIDKEIARIVGLSPTYMPGYVRTLMSRLEANSRPNLVAIAYQRGILGGAR